jgi:hypothetical protein
MRLPDVWSQLHGLHSNHVMSLPVSIIRFWLSGGVPSPILIKYNPNPKDWEKISADMKRLGGVGGVNVGIGGGGGEEDGNGGRVGDITNGAEGVVVGSCAKVKVNKGLMMVSMVRSETRDAMGSGVR